MASCSGSSTPKRPLEVDEEDPQSEGKRWNLKRHQHDVYATSVSASLSRSSSRSSYGRASSVKILNDEVLKMSVGSDRVVDDVEPPQSSRKLRVSCSWPLSNKSRPRALVRSAKHLWLSYTPNLIHLLDCWRRISEGRCSER